MTRTLRAEPSPRRVIRRAGPLVRPHRGVLGAAAAVSLLATCAELAGPVLVGAAVDAVLAGDLDRVQALAVGYGVLALLQLALEAARRRIAALAGERFLADLRHRVAASLLGRPLAFFDAHRPGELLARSTADVDRLSAFIRDGLRQLLDALLLLAVAAAVLVGTSWQLALVALAYLPGAALAVHRYRTVAARANAAEAQAYADVVAAVSETVAARLTVQAAAAEERWTGRLTSAEGRLLAANDTVLRADNRLSVTGFWQLVTLALVLLAGGLLATADTISVGAVATAALLLRSVFAPVDSLSWLYGQAVAARANLARVLDLLDSDHPPIPDPAAVVRTDPRGPGELVLDDVTFGYQPDAPPVLANLSLRVAPGEHVALVGPSGAGKSTLAALAAGLRTPDSGRVLVDGRSPAVGAGRRRPVILVAQEGLVVAGTIADNLRLVPGEHSEADLQAAVARAGLIDWAAGLPDGLQTSVADRGGNLSAGERQLIALARAALADPDVLILDEATADVDPVTEAAVAAGLTRLGAGRTVLVVAHRPDTAARADRVLTVTNGGIAERRRGD